jgi:hypothetical protein
MNSEQQEMWDILKNTSEFQIANAIKLYLLDKPIIQPNKYTLTYKNNYSLELKDNITKATSTWAAPFDTKDSKQIAKELLKRIS